MVANPVKTLAGEKILIQVGDGASPEVFAHPCMINADRGISISADVNDINVIDCDDPSLPGWKEIFKDGMSMEVSGAGVLHSTSIEEYLAWAAADTAKNVRVNFNTTGALGGGYFAVPMKLVQFNIAGTRKQNSTVDLTLRSHGTPAWTDAA